MVDYYQKYIKYKMKYLYEKMKGGKITPDQRKSIIDILNNRDYGIVNIEETNVKKNDSKFIVKNISDSDLDKFITEFMKKSSNKLKLIVTFINKIISPRAVKIEDAGSANSYYVEGIIEIFKVVN